MSRIISVIVLLNIFGLTFAQFENCDQTFNLQLFQPVQVNSPNSPNSYTPGSSCRYKLSAPSETQIQLQCQIRLATVSGACKNEYFYIASDGNLTMANSEFFCGVGLITRNSVYSELTMAYKSTTNTSSNSTSSFTCTATTVPAVPCDCGWSVSTRIVGGVNALVNEYTSMVALVNTVNGSIFCGATIISPTMMLTAATCLHFSNLSNVVLLVGESNTLTGTESPYTKLYFPKKFIKHPNYSSSAVNVVYDIGLIETTEQILYSRGVGPACLPLSMTSRSFDNEVVEAAGWGSTAFGGPLSSTLKKVSLTVISNNVCAQSYPQISQSQMCTYTPGKDTCRCDTGGPLYLRGSRLFLVGIVSYGKGCATINPTVNTRVTFYLGWIQQYVPVSCLKLL